MIATVKSHAFLISTLFFTLSSQILIKWQVERAGALPEDLAGRVSFIVALLLNPWVILAISATFLAGVSWMLTLTKLELSYAYPFMSLIFPMMLIAGSLFFKESLTTTHFVGIFLIVSGIVVIGTVKG